MALGFSEDRFRELRKAIGGPWAARVWRKRVGFAGFHGLGLAGFRGVSSLGFGVILGVKIRFQGLRSRVWVWGFLCLPETLNVSAIYIAGVNLAVEGHCSRSFLRWVHVRPDCFGKSSTPRVPCQKTHTSNNEDRDC